MSCKIVESAFIKDAVQYSAGMEDGFCFKSAGKDSLWLKRSGTPEPVFETSVSKQPVIVTRNGYVLFINENDWIITSERGNKFIYSDKEFKDLFSVVEVV